MVATSPRAIQSWLVPGLVAALLVADFGLVRGLAADPVHATWLGGGRIPVLVAGGEAWRLVSAAFLHVGGGHLAGNVAAVVLLGRLLVALRGAVTFWTVFVVAAVLGSAAGGLRSDAWSMGASGGVAGLLGALAAIGWRAWPAWDAAARRRFGATVLPWVLLAVASPWIATTFVPDHAAHLAGFVVGLALGSLRLPVRAGAALATLTVAYGLGMAVRHGFAAASPPARWTTVAADGVAYEVPASWVPAPSFDPETCATAHTDGLLVVCVGAGAGVAARALDAGFVADTPTDHDPAPPPGAERMTFRPGPDRRPGQRLVTFTGPGPRVVVVHALTTAALDDRGRAIVTRIAAAR